MSSVVIILNSIFGNKGVQSRQAVSRTSELVVGSPLPRRTSRLQVSLGVSSLASGGVGVSDVAREEGIPTCLSLSHRARRLPPVRLLGVSHVDVVSVPSTILEECERQTVQVLRQVVVSQPSIYVLSFRFEPALKQKHPSLPVSHDSRRHSLTRLVSRDTFRPDVVLTHTHARTFTHVCIRTSTYTHPQNT